MNDISLEAQILLQRYDQLRAEIRIRFEARYKLLQLTIMVGAASIGAILTLKTFIWAFFGCLLMIGVSYLLFAEVQFVRTIVGYLLLIEEILDNKFKISVPGWEHHLRYLRQNKPMVQHIQTFSAILFLFLFYTIFNFLGCVGIKTPLRYIIGFLVELPVFVAIYIAIISERKFYHRENGDNTKMNKTT